MPKDGHTKAYNLPTRSEIAVLLSGNLSGNFDIISRCVSGDGQELRRINTCYRSCDPFYVLMFPTGCDGWHLSLTKSNNKTAADFYAFRFQVRLNDFNLTHCVPERFPRLCQAIFTVHIVFKGCIGNWVPVWFIFV